MIFKRTSLSFQVFLFNNLKRLFFWIRPCVIRSGTREVHNKLEKNRRAHLKECFELLKKQLPSQDEKKSSNLSILHAAIRHIQVCIKYYEITKYLSFYKKHTIIFSSFFFFFFFLNLKVIDYLSWREKIGSKLEW